MINPIAGACKNLTPMQLREHSDYIATKLIQNYEDFGRLAAMCSQTTNLARRHINTLQQLEQRGQKAIASQRLEGLEMDTKTLIKLLTQSSTALGEVARGLKYLAHGNDYQLEVNYHIMNTFMRFFPMQKRVAACEQVTNTRFKAQEDFLLQAIQIIADNEQTIEGFRLLMGSRSDPARLQRASKQLLESLKS